MMDSYSTIKRNKLLTHTLIRVNLTNTLNWKPDTKEHVLLDSIYTKFQSWQKYCAVMEIRTVDARGWGWGIVSGLSGLTEQGYGPHECICPNCLNCIFRICISCHIKILQQKYSLNISLGQKEKLKGSSVPNIASITQAAFYKSRPVGSSTKFLLRFILCREWVPAEALSQPRRLHARGKWRKSSCRKPICWQFNLTGLGGPGTPVE